jgi:hypothetical protein
MTRCEIWISYSRLACRLADDLDAANQRILAARVPFESREVYPLDVICGPINSVQKESVQFARSRVRFDGAAWEGLPNFL